jgi:hypothetical protein
MGIDFIAKTGKTFARGWDRGKQELSQPDLFTRHPEIQERTFIAHPSNGTKLEAGLEIDLRLRGAEIALFKDDRLIGRSQSAPQALVAVIHKNGGMARGIIDRTHHLSGACDIVVR